MSRRREAETLEELRRIRAALERLVSLQEPAQVTLTPTITITASSGLQTVWPQGGIWHSGGGGNAFGGGAGVREPREEPPSSGSGAAAINAIG